MFELEPIYKLFKDTGTIPKFKMSKGFRKHWPLPNYIFPLNNNCSYEVKILNFESPAKIYVLPVKSNKKTIDFLENLTKYFTSRSINPFKGIVSSKFDLEHCLCLVKYYGQIYRGDILTWIEPNQFKILLVDYGQTIVAENTEIDSLPEDLAKIPFRAHPLKLLGVTIPSTGWIPAHYSFVNQLFLDKSEVYKVEINNEGFGIIKKNDEDLNAQIINMIETGIFTQISLVEDIGIIQQTIISSNSTEITQIESKKTFNKKKPSKKHIWIHDKIDEEDSGLSQEAEMSFHNYDSHNDIKENLIPESNSNFNLEVCAYQQNSLTAFDRPLSEADIMPSSVKDEVICRETDKNEILQPINCEALEKEMFECSIVVVDESEQQIIYDLNERIPEVSWDFSEENLQTLKDVDINSEGASYVSPSKNFCPYPCGTIIVEDKKKETSVETWQPIKDDFEQQKSSNEFIWPFEEVCRHYISKKGCVKKHCRYPHVDSTQAHKKICISFKTFNQMVITQFGLKLMATVDSITTNGTLLIHLNNYVFDNETLDTLIQSINTCVLTPLTATPGVGELVLAKFNNLYYRARLLEFYNKQAELFLIDIGHVVKNNLYELKVLQKKWLHYPPQTLECYLFNAELIKTQENLNQILNLCANKSFQVVFTKADDVEHKYWIKLLDVENYLDIGKTFIDLGFAKNINNEPKKCNSRRTIFIPG